MKKAIIVICCMLVLFVGCGADTQEITVISREDGSGTRGAFMELFQVKDANGDDATIAHADQTNSTGVMLVSVAKNENAIGYVSIGSLNDSVRAVSIDGAQATQKNIKNGSYKITRKFNAIVRDDLSEAGQDFLSYILSAEGQKTVEENGYISVSEGDRYTKSGVSGNVVIAGSSSVAPVMEKLIEAYEKVNPAVSIELQISDSTTGINSTLNGICDIGMSSRELKESEGGLKSVVMAIDGIAVIVSNKSGVYGLTSEQVKGIYTGKITRWSELN